MTEEARGGDAPGSIRRATLALGAAQAFQLGASFVNVRLLATGLGPEGYGQLATVVATYVLLGALTDLGTGTVAVREMAREPGVASRTLVATVRLRLVLGALASVLGLARWALATGAPEQLAGLVGAGFPLVQAWSGARLLLQARLEHARNARALVIGKVVQVALVAIAARAGTPLAAVLALVLGELATAGLLRVAVRPLPSVSLAETLARGSAIARAAVPLAGAFVAAQLAGTFDVLLLRAWRTLDETGLYAAAERPFAVLESLPRVLLWSAFTIATARAAAGDRAGFARVHRGVLAALAHVAMPLAIGTWVVGPRLLGIVFDARYERAGATVPLLACAAALGFLVAAAESALVALGRGPVVLVASGLALVGNVAANLVLVPRFGIEGAAIAAVVGQSTSAALLHGALIVQERVTPPIGPWARAAASGCVLWVGSAALERAVGPLHPLAIVAAGSALYAGAAWALGGREDLATIGS